MEQNFFNSKDAEIDDFFQTVQLIKKANVDILNTANMDQWEQNKLDRYFMHLDSIQVCRVDKNSNLPDKITIDELQEVIDYVCPDKLKAWALKHYSENKFVHSWALEITRKEKCNGYEVDALLEDFLLGGLSQTKVYKDIKKKHENAMLQYSEIEMEMNNMLQNWDTFDLQKILIQMSDSVDFQYLHKELAILGKVLIYFYKKIQLGLKEDYLEKKDKKLSIDYF